MILSHIAVGARRSVKSYVSLTLRPGTGLEHRGLTVCVLHGSAVHNTGCSCASQGIKSSGTVSREQETCGDEA